MAKARSQYVCQQCGYSQVGWAGKCPNCGAWGSLTEMVIEREKKGSSRKKNGRKKTVLLSSVPSKKLGRVSTKISELDRVLGGGLVSGQAVLIAGEPGIGKSTLLLQLSSKLPHCFYASGEESVHQLRLRADRLKIKSKGIRIAETTDIDDVISTAEELNGEKKLSALVVDSIQTMSTGDLSGMPGSVGQVRECAFRLVRFSKTKGIPVFLVGHVTKVGTVAGPAVLAHIVDSVLWFEGDKSLTLRLLRAVKNRFGPTDEVGIFSMEDKGLISQTNPEKLFVTRGSIKAPGSVITSVLHGTRPMLVEIQSLIVPTKTAFPRRIAQGIDSKRFELILAVLTRRCGLPLFDFDCYLNVSGGMTIKGPSADLAICLSIASSYFDKELPKKTVAIGEVGLLGDVREVIQGEKRAKEARRLGYRQIISQKDFKFVRQAINKLLK